MMEEVISEYEWYLTLLSEITDANWIKISN